MKVSIVSDTSSLIIFSKLDRFDLLGNAFDNVIIPHRVLKETLSKEDKVVEILTQNPLFEIQKTSNTYLLKLLDEVLDYGEAEAITLANDLNHPLLIDEKKGRKIALGMDIKVIGFLGILLLNKRQGKLTVKEAKELVNKAQQYQFRIAKQLQQQFIKLLGK